MDSQMTTLRSRRSKKPRSLVPRVKVWLEIEGCYAFGFGISEILCAVDRAGAIKQAAHEVGRSYSYVWRRVKKAERALGQQLVVTHVGGRELQRSFLTPVARRLVANFLDLRSQMIQVVRQECKRRFAGTIFDTEA
jgi:molybdate transport repressor ModE-like protein